MKKRVVMIHGMWGGPWYWDGYRKMFEKNGYEVITPTLLFHDVGPAEVAPEGLGNTTVGQYADHVQSELEGFEDFILLGHSMGGLIAQILASRGVGRAVILLSPAPPPDIFSLRYSVLRSFMRTIFCHPLSFWRKPHRPSKDSAIYSMLHKIPSREEQARIHGKFVHESGHAAAEIGFGWGWPYINTTRVNSSDVTVPMYIAAGELDRITPYGVIEAIARKYDTDIVGYPNNAHWMVSEPGWEKICQAILVWSDRVYAK